MHHVYSLQYIIIIIPVTVFFFFYRNVAGGAFSKITVENFDITLKEILNRTITKRKDMGRIIGKNYVMGKGAILNILALIFSLFTSVRNMDPCTSPSTWMHGPGKLYNMVG